MVLGRPGVAALKPAPIQVSLMGYPATTGGVFMDYLMTDIITRFYENCQCKYYALTPFYSPPDYIHLYSEKLIVLPVMAWCVSLMCLI